MDIPFLHIRLHQFGKKTKEKQNDNNNYKHREHLRKTRFLIFILSTHTVSEIGTSTTNSFTKYSIRRILIWRIFIALLLKTGYHPIQYPLPDGFEPLYVSEGFNKLR